MKALICDSYDGIEALRVGDHESPAMMPGAVLIDVKAASVNFADILVVAGQYQVRPETPFVPGTELSGIIENADPSSGFAIGDRVAAFIGFGAMAEKAVAFPGSILKLPDAVDYVEAATIPVAYGTSYHALVDRARLTPGQTLLVLGAAGGVGLAAVQIGKALGATVVAAVSSQEKEEAVVLAGADHVIRHDLTPLRDGIASATNGGGVDVVYDPVGGEMSELALRSTNWGGTLLVVGFASGEIPSIPLNLHLVKGNSVAGVFWGRFVVEEPGRNTENNGQIMDWVSEGRLRPTVQRTFDLDDSKEALQWVADRKVVGRVVISI